MKVTFTIGISASGKSQWANRQYDADPLNTRIVCRDWLRHTFLDEKYGKDHAVYNIHKTPTNIWKVWKFGKDEKIITEWWWAEFESAVKSNTQHIIIADTNLNRGRLDGMKQRMRDEFGIVEFEEIVFDVAYEEAVKRDNARPDGVGAEVIHAQWLQFQELKNFGEKYVPVPGSRKAILVDVDGTLAHQGERGIFEWDKVGVDTLDPVVYHIVRGYYQQDYEIIIMSGRDSVCRQETVDWLVGNKVPYTELFMRAENDMRKDSIVKNELFWKHIAHKYDIEACFDDRNQVVHLWQALGLRVIHCGNPWLSF